MKSSMLENRIKCDVSCSCTNLYCHLRGNCVACAALEVKRGNFPECIRYQAEEFGGKLPRLRPKETIVCDSYEDMSMKSATCIVETIKQKPDALLCLPAGNTAIRTYELLKQMKDSGRVDFSLARFVQLDEWLDLDNVDENCAAFLHKYFYDPLQIRNDQIFAFNIHAEDMNQECKRMDHLIVELGGIDLMMLGIGMNGHVALNEPGQPFDSGTKIVELSETTKTVGQKYFSSGAKLSRGMTLGMRQVFDARKVILQAGGQAKAKIISEMYASLPSEKIPATVMFHHKNGTVIFDKDAASMISQID